MDGRWMDGDVEVNASPSLTANTREDYVLKCEMLSDVLDVVDCEVLGMMCRIRISSLNH